MSLHNWKTLWVVTFLVACFFFGMWLGAVTNPTSERAHMGKIAEVSIER